MRWRDLFDDLEAQVMRADREAFEDEVRERSSAERAAIGFGALLAATSGTEVAVVLSDGTRVAGTVKDCVAQWVHLVAGAREWLIPATAISAIEGAPTGAADPGAVATRLTLGHALRALSDAEDSVVVHIAGGEVRGRIGAVGANYVAIGSPARIVPFGAILSVSPAI